MLCTGVWPRYAEVKSDMIVLCCCCLSCQVLGWVKCNSALLFVFCFCAMFSPLVAWHFICDFLALEQGLFCPMWMLTVSLQMYTPEIFSCQRKKDEFSIFLCKLYFGLSCFLSVKTLGDAKPERAYSSAACALLLERNGTSNVFPRRLFTLVMKTTQSLSESQFLQWCRFSLSSCSISNTPLHLNPDFRKLPLQMYWIMPKLSFFMK